MMDTDQQNEARACTEVVAGMETMFAEARAKGLWFFVNYQQLWFTPDELEQHQRAGKFRWGAVNWHLRPPQEYLGQLKREAGCAEADYQRGVARVEQALRAPKTGAGGVK